MRFELFVATRYLRAKRRQAFIGVITGISILGVAAGVASLIVALAINNGFRQDLQARLLGSTAHISLLRVESDGIRNWRPLLEKLSKQPHVVAAAPAIYEQVLISRGPRARGAVLKGMLPRYERKVSDLLNSVTLGSAAALAEEPAVVTGEPSIETNSKASAIATAAGEGARSAQQQQSESPDDLAGVQRRVAAMPPIILGKDMADEIGATVGSVVLVTSPQGELTPFGMVPKYIRFHVAGIFNSGFYDYDSSWAFIRLADAQQLFGLGDVISVIQFKLDDIYLAGEVARSLEQAAGQGFMATSWMEQNKPLFRALRLERVVTFITIGLIVIVAALNILISLIMMVMEKTKDIAVLMSLGTQEETNPPHLHRPGRADRRNRNGDRPCDRLRNFIRGRALPLYFAVARSLFDRLRALRAATHRRTDRRASLHRNFVHSHDLSVMVSCANLAGRGVALRVSAPRL